MHSPTEASAYVKRSVDSTVCIQFDNSFFRDSIEILKRPVYVHRVIAIDENTAACIGSRSDIRIECTIDCPVCFDFYQTTVRHAVVRYRSTPAKYQCAVRQTTQYIHTACRCAASESETEQRSVCIIVTICIYLQDADYDISLIIRETKRSRSDHCISCRGLTDRCWSVIQTIPAIECRIWKAAILIYWQEVLHDIAEIACVVILRKECSADNVFTSYFLDLRY